VSAVKKVVWVFAVLFLGSFLNNTFASSRIVYIKSVSEMRDVFVASLDGDNQQQITTSHSIASCPKWLDSKTIAIISGKDSSHGDIWLIDIKDDNTRGNATQITKFGDVIDLSCSSDGKKISFTRDSFYRKNSPRTLTLAIIDRNSKNYQALKNIANDGIIEIHSCFGSHYLFYSTNDFENHNIPVIRQIDLATMKDKVIFSIPYNEQDGLSRDRIFSINCTKDGSQIIFTGFLHRDSVGNEIFQSFLKIYNITTGRTKTILQKTGELSDFSFMPDEKSVLINYAPGGQLGERVDIYYLSLTSKNDFKIFAEDVNCPNIYY
jgi:Tol biopolymer transport system component